jgi:hypothetical protein
MNIAHFKYFFLLFYCTLLKVIAHVLKYRAHSRYRPNAAYIKSPYSLMCSFLIGSSSEKRKGEGDGGRGWRRREERREEERMIF